MNNNLTQPDEIEFVITEYCDFDSKSEIGNTIPIKSKSSKTANDDEYYIPLYKTSTFN
jgi:hypothetical protein